MTPLPARLTIHEQPLADAAAAAGDARSLIAGGATVAPAQRPLRLVEVDERTPPTRVARESLYRRLLGGADVIGATLALVLTLALAGEVAVGPVALLGVPLIVLLFKVAGLYDRDQLRLVHSTLDEAPLLAQLTGLYALSVTILQPVVFDGALKPSQIAALWVLSFLAIMGGRIFARWVAGHAVPVERCLVIGERTQAVRIREKLASSRANAQVIATLPLERDDITGLDSPESMRAVVNELQVHRILIAPTSAEVSAVAELIRVAKAAGVQVSVLPRMLEVVGAAVELEDVDGMTMLGVRPFGLSRSSRALKRAFDLVATSILLVAVGPIIAAIALAVRLSSKGPAFFRQVRVGRDGEHFEIVKFRSMVDDAEQLKDDLRTLNEVGDGIGDGMFKITSDPRVTRVGSLLRKTSLDELPQLFNVMRGQMSLVGPRPLVTDEDAQVMGLDRSRLHLTPGMTGPWQVLGSRVPMQEMVGIDYLYVANWSLWLDLKLLLRTVAHVMRRGNV